MKLKIEAIGNIVVIAFAVVVGSMFLKDHWSSPAPQSNAVKPGDRLTNLNGWDWDAHDKTLVLVLRRGCPFCEDSAPFYQRLITQQKETGSKPNIMAVFPDSADAVTQVVQSEGLALRALAGVSLDKLNVSGTPTVLLVDKSGTVLNAWMGMLSPRQELEVIRAITPAAANGPESAE